MRVAVVFPLALEPVHLSKDPWLIAAGLCAAGHEAELLCLRDRTGTHGAGLAIREVAPEALAAPAHWRAGRWSGAVVYTWLTSGAPIVAALRAAGIPVCQKADSDGQTSARVHPLATLRRAVISQPTVALRGRAFAFWLRRFAYLHGPEDAVVIANAAAADWTVLETAGAANELERLLRARGRGELAGRLVVVPNPVNEAMLAARVPERRERRIVAVGRWEDPQKDVALVTRALAAVLRERPDVEARVIGSGGEAACALAGRGLGRLRYLGPLTHESLRVELGGARVIVFGSRWEGMPIALGEALTLGCSAVAPALPTFTSLVYEPHGTLAPRRTVRALSSALLHELDAWDRGGRDPAGIAATWRARLAPGAVGRRLAELLTAAPTRRPLSPEPGPGER